METYDKCEKYLMLLALVFITFLLIGSFIVSRDYLDIVYLITLFITGTLKEEINKFIGKDGKKNAN